MNGCKCGECPEFDACKRPDDWPDKVDLDKLIDATTFGIIYHPDLRGMPESTKGDVRKMIATHTASVLRTANAAGQGREAYPAPACSPIQSGGGK